MSTEIFKVFGLILVVCVLAVTLKSYKGEYALLLSLAAVVVILVFILKSVYPAINRLRDSFDAGGIPAECFSVVLKSLGIAYLTGFIADICRDYGHTSLAGKAELAGRCAIFVLCLPLMNSVLDTALGFAGL